MMNKQGTTSGLNRIARAVLLAVGVVVLASSMAAGHQPFESSAVARMEGESMELSVTTSAEIAGMIVGQPPMDGSLTEELKRQLVAAGRDLYEVTADGVAVKPDRVFVNPKKEEVLFSIIYSVGRPAELGFRAAYLDKLPTSYAGSLVILHETGISLGGHPQLKRVGGSETVFVTLPGNDPEIGVSPVQVASTGRASTGAEPKPSAATGNQGRVATALLGSVLLLLLGYRLRHRFSNAQKGSAKSLGRFVAGLIFFLILSSAPVHAQRQMERLGRGIVALRTSSTQVYVGWRLLGNDPEDIAFNVYRSANGGASVKLNGTAVTASTNYTDTPGNLSSTAYTYSVRPVLNGVEVVDTWANPASPMAVSLAANPPTRQYLPVPMQPTPDGAHNVKYCWVGDLDGDGEFDYVVDRWDSTAGTQQWLQAYKRDGTLLWQIALGPNSVNQDNIAPGSSTIDVGHNDGVTVFDMDGDGKAEVMLKTAKGVVFNFGQPSQSTLTAPNDEVQYISVIDGLAGNEKARAQVPVPAGWGNQNHVNGHFGILYCDGLRPSLIFQASNRNSDGSFNKYAATWDYRNGLITQRWLWEAGANEHSAEGHQIRMADVNNDGLDEYVDVGHVVKADGSGQINGDKITEVIHGDRYHLGDADPDRPGLEMYLVQQDNPTGLTAVFQAADRSKALLKYYAGAIVDVGHGSLGPFVPNLFGWQFYGAPGGVYDHKGNQIYSTKPYSVELIWWDGDPAREMIDNDSFQIDKFNSSNPVNTSHIFNIGADPNAPLSGGTSDNRSYGMNKPPYWGDVLGDWREEVVAVAADNSELRVYTTVSPDGARTFNGQPVRIYTMMHNPQYRNQTTTKGYVQAAYPDYYLGYGMATPPPPPMVDAKLVWKGGSGTTTWDAGATASWLNNGADSTYADGDTVRFDLGGNNTTAVTLTGTLQPGALTVFSPKDYTFSGSGTLAGSMKLVKAGAGTMTLPGTHSFTGKTTVWDGALVVNGSLSGSAVSVWGGTWGGAAAAGKTGGRLAGTGQFSQLATIKYRGTVTPGAGMDSAGTIAFGNGLSAEDGATFALDLSDDPTGTTTPNDRIAVTGNLTLAGTVSIVVNPLNGALAAGTYTLVTYTGSLTGSASNLSVVVPSGTPYTIAASGGSIRLTVPATRAAASVVWRGSGANWDLAASQNWLLSGSPDVFVSGDTVTLDATGAAAATATLVTALPTSGVTVNSASNYTFNGSGSLAGSGGLTKSGSGTLTINTLNSYAGPTVINGGILAVSSLADADTPSSIGAASTAASNFVINGGTLQFTGLQTSTNRNLSLGASGGIVDIPSGSSIQFAGTVSGSGSLTKAGAGTLLLIKANNYTGGTVINGGRLYVGSDGNPGGLGSGALSINSGTFAMANSPDGSSENVPWNFIVPAGATARMEADGRCNLNGTLTGSGDLTFYTPYVRTNIAGNWSAFAGRIYVTGDTTSGSDFRVSSTAGFAAAAIDLGTMISGYYTPTLGSNTAIPIGELSGVATSSLGGGPTANRTLTWLIGNRNTDSTYAGVIKNSTSLTALTKVGAGVLTLTGGNTYSGATTVSGGKLLLKGGSITSNVTVAANAGFGGNGAVTGNVNFNAGSVLLGTPTAPLAITGNLTFGGSVTVSPAPGAILTEGTFTLYTYTGTVTGMPTFSWSGSSHTATFDTSVAGQVSVTLAVQLRTPGDITWTGVQSAAWDGTTANWLWTGGPTSFQTNDHVRFDDTTGVTSVTIGSSVTPASVTVDSAQNYVFSGAGSIAGAASLVKSGTGTLTISSAQSFTGGAMIHAGTISVGNGTALGSGTITLNGGALSVGAALGSPIHVTSTGGKVNVSSNRTLSGAITGDGILTAAVSGSSTTMTVGNVSTFAGTIYMGSSTGILRANGSSFTGGADMTLDLGTSTASFLRNNSATTVNIGALAGGTATFLNNGSAATTYSIGAKNLDTVFSGSITGAASIMKVGTGTLVLAGSNTYTGSTQVLAGTLRISGSTSGSTSLTIESGAVLEIPAGANLLISGTITNNGTIRFYGSSSFSSGGTFINNGVIDLINSTFVLPGNFQNNGTIIDSSNVRVQQIATTGGDVFITIQSHSGHNYQLQRNDTLMPATWVDVGSAQAGSGSVLTFADVGGASGSSSRFYRVAVSP